MYVADTHAWIWYLAADPRLGNEAENAFQKADEGDAIMFLPTIVVAEAIYIVKQKAGKFGLEMEKILQDLHQSRNYQLLPIKYPILSRLHTDPRDLSIHDKLLVLLAEQEGYSLISKDDEITMKANVRVLW